MATQFDNITPLYQFSPYNNYGGEYRTNSNIPYFNQHTGEIIYKIAPGTYKHVSRGPFNDTVGYSANGTWEHPWPLPGVQITAPRLRDNQYQAAAPAIVLGALGETARRNPAIGAGLLALGALGTYQAIDDMGGIGDAGSSLQRAYQNFMDDTYYKLASTQDRAEDFAESYIFPGVNRILDALGWRAKNEAPASGTTTDSAPSSDSASTPDTTEQVSTSSETPEQPEDPNSNNSEDKKPEGKKSRKKKAQNNQNNNQEYRPKSSFGKNKRVQNAVNTVKDVRQIYNELVPTTVKWAARLTGGAGIASLIFDAIGPKAADRVKSNIETTKKMGEIISGESDSTSAQGQGTPQYSGQGIELDPSIEDAYSGQISEKDTIPGKK